MNLSGAVMLALFERKFEAAYPELSKLSDMVNQE